MKISQYAKSILYIAIAAAAVLSTSTDWSTVTIINAAIAAAGVVPVYWVTQEKYLKSICAGIVAALQALLILLGPSLGFGAIDPHAWISVILTGLAAGGVAIIPNNSAAVPSLMTISAASNGTLHVTGPITVGSVDPTLPAGDAKHATEPGD